MWRKAREACEEEGGGGKVTDSAVAPGPKLRVVKCRKAADCADEGADEALMTSAKAFQVVF